jgi:hypothetical protein
VPALDGKTVNSDRNCTGQIRIRAFHHNAPESSQPQVERERRAALARFRVLPASIVDSERGEPYFALLPP